ncbi:MAG TPA: methylated-DNA--[protein]-cysteine S-methyltransferase [Acidimicrobiales bacterium]|nr:methylated-DNA--[protein]-cysteine S-methyltransferase [Acidimicrobiales bacterium]
MTTYLTHVDSPVGIFSVEGDERAVTAIYLPNDQRRASSGPVPRAVARAAAQLREYFDGRRKTFSVALADVPATDFQRSVWSTMRDIPYGSVMTYTEVADAAGHPGAQRAVGNTCHANPMAVIVPCHRVVAATGLGGYGGGDAVKRYLLELEGVSL